jgi:hypothetical protein
VDDAGDAAGNDPGDGTGDAPVDPAADAAVHGGREAAGATVRVGARSVRLYRAVRD